MARRNNKQKNEQSVLSLTDFASKYIQLCEQKTNQIVIPKICSQCQLVQSPMVPFDLIPAGYSAQQITQDNYDLIRLAETVEHNTKSQFELTGYRLDVLFIGMNPHVDEIKL